jgi:hypothetical protein
MYEMALSLLYSAIEKSRNPYLNIYCWIKLNAIQWVHGEKKIRSLDCNNTEPAPETSCDDRQVPVFVQEPKCQHAFLTSAQYYLAPRSNLTSNSEFKNGVDERERISLYMQS